MNAVRAGSRSSIAVRSRFCRRSLDSAFDRSDAALRGRTSRDVRDRLGTHLEAAMILADLDLLQVLEPLLVWEG